MIAEIVKWERRDDGLIYLLVKFVSTSGSDEIMKWLPIYEAPQVSLLNYIRKLRITDKEPALFLHQLGNNEKVKALYSIANASANEVKKELFISDENPPFFELKMRANKNYIEQRLAELLSSSTFEEVRQLLIDVTIEKNDLIVDNEPVTEEELCEIEAEINVVSNDRKAIRLSKNIRNSDMNSLRRLRYSNTISIPPSLTSKLNSIKEVIPCSCTGKKCLQQLHKCEHYRYKKKPLIGAYDDEGCLVAYYLETKEVIYECNSNCKCDSSCPNRVVQNGSSIQKEVFSTMNGYGIGLGVRALERVKKGAFIASYAGTLVEYEENSPNQKYNPYLFEVAGSRKLDGSYGLLIDASDEGNIARLINHNCQANLTILPSVQTDSRIHEVAFFANREIEAGEELCIKYGRKYFENQRQMCYCFCRETGNKRKCVPHRVE